MSRSFKFSCILIAALAFAACGDGGDDGSGSTTNPAGADAGGVCTTDNYAMYGKTFFMTNCVACHNASLDMSKMMNVKLDTQAGVQAAKAAIIQRAVQLVPPIMPMAGALPPMDRERLKKWLDCGAL